MYIFLCQPQGVKVKAGNPFGSVSLLYGIPVLRFCMGGKAWQLSPPILNSLRKATLKWEITKNFQLFGGESCISVLYFLAAFSIFATDLKYIFLALNT